MDQADGNCIGKMNTSENQNKSADKAQANANNNNEEAIMPVDQHSLYYNMNHQSRGLLMIFNHVNFDASTGLDNRSGTDKDVKKIMECFNTLGFEIHDFHDLTLYEIRSCIMQCVRQDHNNRDCLAIFVLTHGDKNRLFAKNTSYNPAVELWSHFTSDKCPSLAGKPKLVFLQSCQGKEFDKGIKLVVSHSTTEFDGAFRSYKLPVYADFLFFYATFEDYFAFRNNVNGSYWVTLLCDELKKNCVKKDILTILTYVNRRLAVEFTSANTKDKSKHGLKQMSYFKSSLTRSLVFGEK